nr:fibro-slime domain-containing protein [Nannocystis sp.]
MLKTEARSLTYTLTFLGALNLACSNTPIEGTAGASEAEASDTDGSASAASDTAPTTTTAGSVSNSATESTVSGNTDGMTQATTDDVTTEALTSAGTGTTSQLETSDTGTSTGPDTTDTGTSGDTSGGTSSTGGDTTTTGGDTSTTGGDTSTGEPVDCGLQLKATIRDFKVGHPDFQSYCCGVVTGLVKADLGADKKPAFNQVGNPKMLTDAPTFNQWYNTIKDINMATQIVLDLQEIQPGVFSYQNNAFFPIDDQLFGNEGNNHNFHFTTEIHTLFAYNGGETFTFTGDDDVWVFINKKLAIDIGGVHGNTAGMVKLDDLGLTVGQTYPLDVFHAERHTTQSNFRIDTTICSVPQ